MYGHTGVNEGCSKHEGPSVRSPRTIKSVLNYVSTSIELFILSVYNEIIDSRDKKHPYHKPET